jgi:hypothetical protein
MTRLLIAKKIILAILGRLKQIPVNTSAYRNPKNNDNGFGVGVMLINIPSSEKA